MYYIRKLSNKQNLYKIKENESVSELEADILRQELSTYENAISFWKCKNLSDITDTIKAILLSTTSIKVSQFIILDDQLLARYNIGISTENIGKTGYVGFENLHVDLIELNYEKIGKLLQAYKDVAEKDAHTPMYDKKAVRELIKQVIIEEKLDKNNVHEDLLKDIKRSDLL